MSERVDLHTCETKKHTTLHRYTTSFALNVSEGSNVIVVLDGVKMGAIASFNGRALGEIRSQFLRYTFPLDAAELGAWTMVAHLLLNLSETVTKG